MATIKHIKVTPPSFEEFARMALMMITTGTQQSKNTGREMVIELGKLVDAWNEDKPFRGQYLNATRS